MLKQTYFNFTIFLDPALAMLNRKPPLDLIKTFEVESTEKGTISASTVTKPIKESAEKSISKTKSKKKYLAKPKPPTPSIASDFSNEEQVSPDDVVSIKISSKRCKKNFSGSLKMLKF